MCVTLTLTYTSVRLPRPSTSVVYQCASPFLQIMMNMNKRKQPTPTRYGCTPKRCATNALVKMVEELSLMETSLALRGHVSLTTRLDYNKAVARREAIFMEGLNHEQLQQYHYNTALTKSLKEPLRPAVHVTVYNKPCKCVWCVEGVDTPLYNPLVCDSPFSVHGGDASETETEPGVTHDSPDNSDTESEAMYEEANEDVIRKCVYDKGLVGATVWSYLCASTVEVDIVPVLLDLNVDLRLFALPVLRRLRVAIALKGCADAAADLICWAAIRENHLHVLSEEVRKQSHFGFWPAPPTKPFWWGPADVANVCLDPRMRAVMFKRLDGWVIDSMVEQALPWFTHGDNAILYIRDQCPFRRWQSRYIIPGPLWWGNTDRWDRCLFGDQIHVRQYTRRE